MRIMTTSIAILLAAGCGSSVRADLDSSTDSRPDTGHDSSVDTAHDPGHDPGVDPSGPQCADGIDNDGDDLVDMEDFDCENPSDDVEGPEDGCLYDNHCAAGWEECDRATGECYDPPFGAPCEECESSEDCGDGVGGDDPDRDYCVYYGYSWHCAKDCVEDYDCPRGYWCRLDDSSGARFCRPRVVSCNAMDWIGDTCGEDYDCAFGALTCHDGFCSYSCEAEHWCMEGTTCTDGWCMPG